MNNSSLWSFKNKQKHLKACMQENNYVFIFTICCVGLLDFTQCLFTLETRAGK